MQEEIKYTIQRYLESYYKSDFKHLISLLDADETNQYVEQFISFAVQMDQFGESEDFLKRLGIDRVETLTKMTTYEFMTKILHLMKKELDDETLKKIISTVKITKIERSKNLATVNYTYSISYLGEDKTMDSILHLTNASGKWRIRYESSLDRVLSKFQKEIDLFEERKAKDQIQHLNHHVNDLEKITLIGYKNMNGEIVFEPRFKDGGEFSDGLAYVQVFSKYGYIDKTGEIVIKPRFKAAHNFSEGLAGVQLSNLDKWGFINVNGKMVIEPQFDKISEFNEGLCAVSINEKWGYVDKTGHIVIECQYEEANDFWDDETDVVRLNKDGDFETIYINKLGDIVEEE